MKYSKRIYSIKHNRINDEIKSNEIRLIGVNNELIGIVNLNQGLQYAKKLKLDLVEISPNANPIVCRIMDYGKFLYKKSKNLKEQKKKQKIIQIKEVKFRPNTDIGDYQVKLKHLNRFLMQGHKVKITLRFRGREMAYKNLGIVMLKRIRDDLSIISFVESFPLKIEGRQMIMILSPKKK
ncbi:translation initiation factor IF-3 [Buchnera aphidicola]|uniref:Translation initiation factor IF-3 n=1 Tax=Buchnera aphidicola (Therioaphis trifolii) TaxID=1241884 RepID=A0A4D6YB11_9GAMM|nr:translation initiation factor IF-3 [Buchnera aphidicola]QCI27097.1 translation initiation factor IF-3 [Buchnera aphidicola (Therioaphis trifolii)]